MRTDSILKTRGEDISTRAWHASLAFSPPRGCGMQALAIPQIQALFSLPSKSTLYTSSHEGRSDPWKPRVDKQSRTFLLAHRNQELSRRDSALGLNPSSSYFHAILRFCVNPTKLGARKCPQNVPNNCRGLGRTHISGLRM